MESERSAVTSTSVVDRAARTVGPSDPEAVRDSLTVVVPSQSLILKVTSTTRDPQQAADWANAVTEAYLADRTASADDAAERIIARLKTDLDERLRARAAQPPADRALTDQDIASLRERMSTLTTVGLNPGRVITPAVAPSEPSSLPLAAYVVGGQGLGLLVGICLALSADRLGTRVRSRARLTWATGWPVQAVRGDAHPSVTDAVERALAVSTEGTGRYVLLDLSGQGCPELVAELHEQRRAVAAELRDTGVADGLGAEPEVVDLTQVRSTAAAARCGAGDVVLVVVDVDALLETAEECADALAARGAEVAAAVLLPRRRHRAAGDGRAAADGADGGDAADGGEAADGGDAGSAAGAPRAEATVVGAPAASPAPPRAGRDRTGVGR